MNRKEMIEKVKKLLALAARGGTPGEAAAAASRAQVLMDQWDMAHDELEAGDANDMISTLDEREGWIDTMSRTLAWKHTLFGRLAILNGVAAFIGYRGRGRSLECTGRRAAVEKVRMLYVWIVQEIERMAKRRTSMSHSSFCFGMAEMITTRLREDQRLAHEQARAAAQNKAALMRIESAMERARHTVLAEFWMASRPDVTVNVVEQQFDPPDPIARAEGHRAGLRVDLSGPNEKIGPGEPRQ